MSFRDKQSQMCKKIWKVDLNHNLKEVLKLENIKLAVEKTKFLDNNPQKRLSNRFFNYKSLSNHKKIGFLTSVK
ncbi:MAG: hypothetical protein EAZ97_09535 [Bacteroidetes bacterium]|nr:MAG: hypothetical protein EAZ97_09535 [Bacteroidota bacterium]